jgi:hypothetical protein
VVRSVFRSIHIVWILAAIAVLVLAPSGCSLLMLGNLDAAAGTSDPTPDPTPENDAILFSGAQLTLAWDPPPSPVSSYKLFYRIHGTATWALLDEIGAAAAPEYTVDHANLGNGDFDFGVVAVAEDQAESQMHTSLDNTAQPDCGWYLCWVN